MVCLSYPACGLLLTEATRFSAFQVVGAWANTGMSLVDQNMVPFREAYPMIIFLVFDVLAGNTGFVSDASCVRTVTYGTVPSQYCEYSCLINRRQHLNALCVFSLRFLMCVGSFGILSLADDCSVQLGAYQAVTPRLSHQRSVALPLRPPPPMFYIPFPR